MEEINGEDHSLNSARDIKVVNFACFINKKETIQNKKKKERKSEMTTKTRIKQYNNMSERDLEDEDDDYIPIKFVSILLNQDDKSDNNKKVKPTSSKYKLNLNKITYCNNPLQKSFNDSNNAKSCNNNRFKFFESSITSGKNKSNHVSNFVQEHLSKHLNTEL